ncbi:DegV family protein [Intestinimonas timonensis]|uniref:DegV family protein n=1 Tax=Intestinimonas timonensis TaxID=1689270 RepID=UPI003A9576AB
MVRIVTDSTCDLSPERQKALGVEVVPLSVHFGEESFLDGIDLSNEEFYARLREAETLPTTAQVNPEEFISRFQAHMAAGDQVVGIFLASQLSGTCQSAMIARDMVDEDNIFVLDSTTVTFGLGLLVEMAARLRDQGLDARTIAQKVEALAKRLRFYAVVSTLKYLKMGGRISGTAAVVGGMLGITPILNIRDGVVEAAAKSRGRKGAFQWMEKQLQAEPADLSLPVSFGNADSPDIMAECEAALAASVPGAEVLESSIGSVVGTHAGPGCTGIAYFVKE